MPKKDSVVKNITGWIFLGVVSFVGAYVAYELYSMYAASQRQFARGPRSPPEFAEARLDTNGKPTSANSSRSRLNDRCDYELCTASGLGLIDCSRVTVASDQILRDNHLKSSRTR